MSAASPTSILSIFVSFAKIGAVLIGGGYAMLPLLEDEIVRRKKWTTSEEITDYFALAQLLPGVIAINTAMLVGNRLRGLAGNLAASVGVVSVPFALIGAVAGAVLDVLVNEPPTEEDMKFIEFNYKIIIINF